MSDDTSSDDWSGGHEGGCLCGHVRFRVSAPPVEPVGNCHCRLCQKASGAAYVTWAIFKETDVTWTAAPPKWHRSTDFAERGFCPHCGSTVSIHDFTYQTMDLAVALFDNPNAFAPEDDIWRESRINWVALDPALPHYQRAGPEHEEGGT